LPLPVDIYSVDAVRDIDDAAINEAGISGYTLMTRAANAALTLASRQFPEATRWQVICGAGNNAGDGYVLARLAATKGITVSVLSVVPPEKLTGDARRAFADFSAAGGQHSQWSGTLDVDATLLIDGLLGSGIDRPVEGLFAEIVAAINDSDAAVLSLDIPSGIDGDTGKVLGTAVLADLTVTFVGLKTGLFLSDGPAHVGDLRFADLEIPARYREKSRVEMRRINDALLASNLPPRNRDTHKGDFGHLVAIGGGPGMPGAIALCGEAALRCGAGRVTLATHVDHHAALAAARPELMCHAVTSATDLKRLLANASTLLIGPGLGQSDWARQLFSAAMESDLSMVVDADALNLLAKDDVRRPDWILTPHPGEAARLLNISTATVQLDRREALAELKHRYGGTIVLKGAGTYVSSANGIPWICDAGNPGMAAPGMGDVLTGVIAALLAQGLPAEMAAAVGVEVHSRAGDKAATDGERGLMASDLMPYLRVAVNPG